MFSAVFQLLYFLTRIIPVKFTINSVFFLKITSLQIISHLFLIRNLSATFNKLSTHSSLAIWSDKQHPNNCFLVISAPSSPSLCKINKKQHSKLVKKLLISLSKVDQWKKCVDVFSCFSVIIFSNQNHTCKIHNNS
jgi:hypothetical protein